MSKPIAVQGCTLEIVEEGKSALSIQISTSPSSNVKFDGKGAYSGQLSIVVSGYTGGDIVSASGSGEGTLSGTAQYVKIDGEAAVLEDDKSLSIQLVGVNSRGRTAYDSCTVKVANSGQDYVKGE